MLGICIAVYLKSKQRGEIMGYHIFRRPQILLLFVIVIMRLFICFVGLWMCAFVCGVRDCGFVRVGMCFAC